MLGLGSSIVSKPVIGKSIVRDGLVLQHNYSGGPVQPISSGAASFVRSGIDHIDLGASNGFITGNNVTIAVWFRLTDSNSIYLMQNQKATGSTNLALLLNKDVNGAAAGKVSSIAWGGSSHTYLSYDGNVDTDGKWHHLAVTLGGSGQKLYFDGVLVAENTVQFSNSASADNMFIGALNGAGSAMDGYVCNAGIWSETLSQAQIKSIMQKDYAGLSDSEKTSLVSWWNLDSVVEDTTTLVYDNHHGGGEVLGGEMVQNGSFDNGTTNWTKSGTTSATQEIVNGALKMYTGTAGDNSNQMSYTSGYSMSGVSGKTYRLRITASDFTSSSGSIRLDGVYLSGSAGSITFVAGTQDVYFTAYRNFTTIAFFGASHSNYYTIDDVSLKLVNGNTGTLS